jgi:hypothetical protein
MFDLEAAVDAPGRLTAAFFVGRELRVASRELEEKMKSPLAD